MTIMKTHAQGKNANYRVNHNLPCLGFPTEITDVVVCWQTGSSSHAV